MDLSFPLTIWVENSQLLPMDFFYYLRQFWTHKSDYATVGMGTAYGIACLVIANLCYMAFLVHFYSDKRSSVKPPKVLTQIMHQHIFWSSGPLIIPYTSIMLTYITCHPGDTSCTLVAVHPAEFAFFLVLIFCQNLLALLYKVSVYDWSPFSHLPAAKIHSRVCIVATPVRSVVTVVFGFSQYERSAVVSYLLNVVCICYQCVLTFCFWYEQPFHRRFINNVYVGMYAIAAMASLAVMFAQFAGGSGDIACIGIFVIGSLLLIPAVGKLGDLRLNFAQQAPLSQLKTATDVELRVRHELVKLLEAATERANNNDLEDASTLNTTEIENILMYFAKEFRYSFKFNSIWAAYLYLFKANKFVAMQKTRVILNHSPMVFDIIPLQIRLRFFAETSSSEDMDSGLESFEEQLRLQRYAIDALARAISLQARFWGTLVSKIILSLAYRECVHSFMLRRMMPARHFCEILT
jgi:hypothetical protein